MGAVAIWSSFGLQWDRVFGRARLLPGVADRVALANKSPSQAIVTFGTVVSNAAYCLLRCWRSKRDKMKQHMA